LEQARPCQHMLGTRRSLAPGETSVQF